MPPQENVQPFRILPRQGRITESEEGEESKHLRLQSYESESRDALLHIIECAAIKLVSACDSHPVYKFLLAL